MDDADESGRTSVQVSVPPRRRSTGPEPAGGDPLIGQRLGDYVVRERIGSGGMGLVYRGEHVAGGRPAAIKVVASARAADPVFIERFLAEARIVASVRHPNIVDVYGLGLTPDHLPYLAMELLEGETLEDYLRYEGGQLPARDAVELLSQTAAALAAAHAAGVIHRDLKPANIFVVPIDAQSRFIKLLDFGVAKRTAPYSSARSTSAMVGTPLYMAPEAADGAEVGPFTDLYSLGCVAYELVTGHPPFDAANVLDAVLQHHDTRPQTPTAPGVPASLSRLILQLLEKQPAQRPASASVVRQTLEGIAAELDRAPRTEPAVAMLRVRTTRIRPAPATSKALPAIAVEQAGPVRPTVVSAPPRRARAVPALVGTALVAAIAAGVVLWPGAPAVSPPPAQPLREPRAEPVKKPEPPKKIEVAQTPAVSPPEPVHAVPDKPAAPVKKRARTGGGSELTDDKQLQRELATLDALKSAAEDLEPVERVKVHETCESLDAAVGTPDFTRLATRCDGLIKAAKARAAAGGR